VDFMCAKIADEATIVKVTDRTYVLYRFEQSSRIILGLLIVHGVSQ